jgi:oligosaccharide reducing-end xylanase
VSEGLDSYGATYELDGSGKSGMHGSGMTAINAMLAFSLSAEDGTPFVQRAWDASTPTGTYRYYDGTLFMLAMLHLSGKFRLFY